VDVKSNPIAGPSPAHQKSANLNVNNLLITTKSLIMNQFSFCLILSLLGLGHSVICQSAQNPSNKEAKEKAVIISVIENETACYYRADYDCWKDTWSQKDPVGFVFWGALFERKSWKEIDEGAKNDFKGFKENAERLQLSTQIKFNFQVNFLKPDVALVFFDENSTDQEGKCTYGKGIRLMQKEGGKWRIVMMNALFDPSKPCDQK
jgi:hypothetical protein